VQANGFVLAPDRREMDVSVSTLGTWVRAFLSGVLSLVPGLSIGDVSLTEFTAFRPFPNLAWILVGLVAIAGIVGVFRGRNAQCQSVAAQLVLLALLISLIPSLSGTVSFRYFVAPITLLVIALLILLDKRLEKQTPTRVRIGSVLLGLLWLTSFPSSELRSTPAPAWSAELNRANALCQAGLNNQVSMTLTPPCP